MNQFTNIEIEARVLGSLLMSIKVQNEIFADLNIDYFTDIRHRTVFQAMKDMIDKDASLDTVTLASTLLAKGTLETVGGGAFISSLTSRITSFASIQKDVLLLKELLIKRKLYSYGQEVCYKLEHGCDVFETSDRLLENLNKIYVECDSKENIITTRQAVQAVVNQINLNRSTDKALTGIPSGFYFFDRKTGGLQEGNLIVVAGESSQGKTSLALSITLNATKQGYSGAYYSLEMGSKELTARLISMNLSGENVKPSDLLYKRLDDNTYSLVLNNAEQISNCQIFFDERANSKLDTIVRSIKMLKAKYNIKFVVVDYLQIMTAFTRQNKEGELAEIARELKNVAVKEKVSVILLSQLARDRNNPEPTNARLRGSGQIEEASDMILLVYRPEVYGLQYTEDGLQDRDTHGTALIKVSKGRNTGVFNFLVGFDADHTRFYDLRESTLRTFTPNINFDKIGNNDETF